ncbi:MULTISPECIES: immunity 49 family protein [unclassified Mycobacterium]|uniref:immunity 49 family protein n=1 Tax=unclassified Mycobacterium TaxID=2642494 RepID=UPI000894CE5B|nr:MULTISPECIES: immunity 49 family protein [unclassified Mycobacterium]SEA23957.1 Immunity protein 49 [Mycobacterium sp. 283mftsu]
MLVINRHQIDLDDIEQRIQELFEDIDFTRGLIEAKPQLTERLFTYSSWIADYSSVEDPDAALLRIWDATWMAMQAGSAMFLNANNKDRDIEFTLGFDDKVATTGTGPNSSATAGKWLAAMYFAIACRRDDRITSLCATPVETLRAAGAAYDEYIYDWVTAFQKFFRRDDDVVRAIITAMEGADPERVKIAKPELLLLLLYPPIELLYCVTQGNAEEFNTRLARAIEDHKKFWSKTADRRRDVEGFIAWGPLAMACIAHDMGMAITVETPYLPKHLILGSRATESQFIRQSRQRRESSANGPTEGDI